MLRATLKVRTSHAQTILASISPEAGREIPRTKILAAADDDDIFNGTCGAESGWVPVSGVAPSVLISEM